MTTTMPTLAQCTNCGHGWHTTERCPEPGRGPAGHTERMHQTGDSAIVYTAAIGGTGPTTGHRIEVAVDPDAPGGPAALIDCTGALVVDADGLRWLAAACNEAADRLDAEQRRAL